MKQIIWADIQKKQIHLSKLVTATLVGHLKVKN